MLRPESSGFLGPCPLCTNQLCTRDSVVPKRGTGKAPRLQGSFLASGFFSAHHFNSDYLSPKSLSRPQF